MLLLQSYFVFPVIYNGRKTFFQNNFHFPRVYIPRIERAKYYLKSGNQKNMVFVFFNI